eukprot:CAMPEP_0170109554 /NCGR_PEP_ID=MMETSP0020_2-20130122/7278_1 /TAXON_ID=98059 /ORGANISM="Dinobryon sp., Strain UTEXLB2267" /LENGTH=2286 /DNA_ID=CAMNT_0010334573 /DNA_START=4168 /DNA_END=11025 /DNA_ORIENTATION=+
MTNTKCQWIDDLSFYLYPDVQKISALDLTVGSTISILKNTTLRAKCVWSQDCTNLEAVAAQNVTVMMNPTNQLSPSVVISSPSTIDDCSSLVLDATASVGSAGRKWSSVTMNAVDSKSRQITDIQIFLNKNFSPYIPCTVPAEILNRNSTYSFTLTLCNYLKLCATSIRIVKVVDNSYLNGCMLPNVRIIGQEYRTLLSSHGVKIRALAYIQTCYGKKSYSYLNYTWSMFTNRWNNSQLLAISSVSRDSSVFKLSPYTLTPGYFYTLVVNVTNSISLLSSVSVVYLNVVKSGLVAVLKGNTHRDANVGVNVTLDASESRDNDLDVVTGVAAGLKFTWKCIQILPLYRAQCPAQLYYLRRNILQNDKIIIKATTLAINVTLRVTVTVFDSTRTDSVHTDITIHNLNYPAISIDFVPSTSLSSASSFNTNTSLYLQGNIHSGAPCVASWNWDYSDSKLSAVASSPLTKSVSRNVSTIFNFIISAHMLPTRSSIIFFLSCGDIYGTALKIYTNSPPQPGSFAVSPISGLEMVTSFNFIVSLWSDVDLPLHFQFGYISPVVKSKLIMVTMSELTYVETLLPAGSPTNSDILFCVADISDFVGATSTVQTQIRVHQTNSSILASSLEKSTENLMSLSMFQANQVITSAIGSSLITYVDCSLAPNCFILNRSNCVRTPQTCGTCFDGFVGDIGDSNSPCLTAKAYKIIVNTLNASQSLSCRTVADCPSVWYTCASMLLTSNKTCTLKSKNTSPSQCSNHGTVQFIDSRTGATLPSCNVFNPLCVTICRCQDGFIGIACENAIADAISKQSILHVLISSLQSLTTQSEQTDQNVLSWAASLSTLTNSNAYLLNYTDLVTLHSVINSILVSAKEIQLSVTARNSADERQMLEVLATTNILSSVYLSKNCSDNIIRLSNYAYCKNGSNYASSLIDDVTSKFINLVVPQFLDGMEMSSYKYGNFEFSIGVLSVQKSNTIDFKGNLSFTSSHSVSLQISNKSQVGLATVAVLETFPKSYSKNSFLDSNPLSIEVYLYGTTQLMAISGANIALIHDNAIPQYRVGYVPESFLTSCSGKLDFTVHSYQCADSGTIIRRSCDGRSGSFINYCPSRSATCSTIHASTGALSTIESCLASNITSFSTTCRCSFKSNTSKTLGGSHRSLLLSDEDGSQFPTSIVSSFKFIPYSTPVTFYSADVGITDGSYSFVLLVSYSSLWAACLLLIFWNIISYPQNQFSIKKGIYPIKGSTSLQFVNPVINTVSYTLPLNNREEMSKSEVESSIQRYITSYFPSVYAKDAGILKRMWLEWKSFHRYLVLFTQLDSLLLKKSVALNVFKAISFMSVNLFILLILFEGQFPLTNSKCSSMQLETDCNANRAGFIVLLPRCQWTSFRSSIDGLEYHHCDAASQRLPAKAVVYLLLLSILIAAVPVVVFDVLFRYIEAPLLRTTKTLPSSTDTETSAISLVSNVELDDKKSVAPDWKELIGIQPFVNCSRINIKISRDVAVKTGRVEYERQFRQWMNQLQKQANSMSLVDKSRNLLELEYNQLVTTSSGQQESVQKSERANNSSIQRMMFRHSQTVVPVRNGSYDVEPRNPLPTSTSSIYSVKLASQANFNLSKVAPEILQQRQVLVDRRQDCLSRQEIDLLQDAVDEFDKYWALHNSRRFKRRKVTNAVDDGLKTLPNRTQRVLLEEIMHSKQETLRLKSKLKYLSEEEIGFELIYSFILDLIGRNSEEARLFELKFDLQFSSLKSISNHRKRLAWYLLVLFNGSLFFYLLYICYKSTYIWQAYFLLCTALLTVLETLIVSTFECLWIHFAIPDMCSETLLSVQSKISSCIHEVLNSNVSQISSVVPKDTIPMVLNAPDHLFVSTALAAEYPTLLESLIINSYRGHLPSSPLTGHDLIKQSTPKSQWSTAARYLFQHAAKRPIKAIFHWFRKLHRLNSHISADVTNRNIFFFTNTCFALVSSIGALLPWQLHVVLIRVFLSGSLLLLVFGWYSVSDSLAMGLYIGAVVVFSLFLALVLIDQFRFYNRRFKNRLSSKSSSSLPLTLDELSQKLVDIRSQLPADVSRLESVGGSDLRLELDEENKSVGSLGSIAKSLSAAVSRASRASSWVVGDDDDEELQQQDDIDDAYSLNLDNLLLTGGGLRGRGRAESNISSLDGDLDSPLREDINNNMSMLKDPSHEYIVDSSSLSDAYLPTAMSLDQMSELERFYPPIELEEGSMEEKDSERDDDEEVEIVDHVLSDDEVDIVDNSSVSGDSEDSSDAGQFRFDTYEVAHDATTLRRHHMLVQQHHHRK